MEAQHFALFVPLPFQILCFLFLVLLSWNCGPRLKAMTQPICAFVILVRRAMERERQNEIWCGRGKKHLARSMEGRSGEGLIQGRAGCSLCSGSQRELLVRRNLERTCLPPAVSTKQWMSRARRHTDSHSAQPGPCTHRARSTKDILLLFDQFY